MDRPFFADYMLWWAWRLHSYWEEKGRTDGNVYYTGVAAARLALAELARLASLILHEAGHLPLLAGSRGMHCRELGTGIDCPQDTMETLWFGKSAVLYGHPAPLTSNNGLSAALSEVAAAAARLEATEAQLLSLFTVAFTADQMPFFGRYLTPGYAAGESLFRQAGSFGGVDPGPGEGGCPDGTFETTVLWEFAGSQATVNIKYPIRCSSTRLERTIIACIS